MAKMSDFILLGAIAAGGYLIYRNIGSLTPNLARVPFDVGKSAADTVIGLTAGAAQPVFNIGYDFGLPIGQGIKKQSEAAFNFFNQKDPFTTKLENQALPLIALDYKSNPFTGRGMQTVKDIGLLGNQATAYAYQFAKAPPVTPQQFVGQTPYAYVPPTASELKDVTFSKEVNPQRNDQPQASSGSTGGTTRTNGGVGSPTLRSSTYNPKTGQVNPSTYF